MKKITKLLIFLSIIFGCSSEHFWKGIKPEAYEINGKVESFFEKRYSAKMINDSIFPDSVGHGKIFIEKYFNSNGYLEKSLFYNQDSILILKQIPTHNIFGNYLGSKDFDSANKLIKTNKIIEASPTTIIIESNDEIKKTSSKSRTEYDLNKKMIRQVNFINDTNTIEWTFNRNGNGLVESTATIWTLGNISDTTKVETKYLEFDLKNNWILKIEYKNDSIEKGIYVYERRINYK